MGIKEGMKAVFDEVADVLADKVIPQGAGEIAHALNTGSAYLPYGQGQEPIEPAQDKGGGYDQMLDNYAAQAPQPEPDMGLDR